MENEPRPPLSSGDEDQANLHNSLISTFCEITSATPSEALFYLESHNFDLDSALSTFLETTNPPVATAAAAAVAPVGIQSNSRNDSPGESESYSPSKSQSQSQSQSQSHSSSPSRSRSPSPPPSRRSQYNLRSSSSSKQSPSATARGSRRRGASGVRTLADLNRQASDGGLNSDSDEPPEYFTGGEKSGMTVRDPSKSNDVDAIFNQARQAGGVERPVDQLQPSSSSRSFTGTARLLSGETVSHASEQPVVVTHNITFWRNGFTIDDGPLRRLDDPENASFLESISRSECPKELQPRNKATTVHVNLIRKEENYTEPQRPQLPFQGVGRTLASQGDITPTEPSAAASSLPTALGPTTGLIVDQTLPTTSIQLRLADGTRMISRFNYHHTLRDVRGFIDASRPGGSRDYQLQTVGFPPKQLTDLDQTIEQAGLANSVVIQKLN